MILDFSPFSDGVAEDLLALPEALLDGVAENLLKLPEALLDGVAEDLLELPEALSDGVAEDLLALLEGLSDGVAEDLLALFEGLSDEPALFFSANFARSGLGFDFTEELSEPVLSHDVPAAGVDDEDSVLLFLCDAGHGLE